MNIHAVVQNIFCINHLIFVTLPPEITGDQELDGADVEAIEDVRNTAMGGGGRSDIRTARPRDSSECSTMRRRFVRVPLEIAGDDRTKDSMEKIEQKLLKMCETLLDGSVN